MNLTKYVACICEGAAEKAIMEILLDADKLIFKRDDLLEGELLRCRSGKNFEEQHLRKGFTEKITVLRILDSRREQFRLSKAYEHKIEIINVITAPEIEMLVIFNEDKYEEYKKSGKKPSDFCKTDLKYPNVKSTDFVKRYNTTKSETYPVLLIIIIFQDIFKCELRLDNHLGQSYNASVPPYTIAKLNQYLARFFHAVLRSLGARKNAPTRCIVAILQCIVFSKDIFEF